jgi:PPOX class probable F420-dependent enzyme
MSGLRAGGAGCGYLARTVRTLGEPELRAFLLAGTRTAKVAVVRRDGSPLVTPVWFLPDEDGSIVFETGRSSVKGHALARDPRVSICVEDDEPPFGFVRVDGIAELSHDRDELLSWATRIAARYMGADRAEEFGRRNAAPSELLVRVRPQRIIAQVELAD